MFPASHFPGVLREMPGCSTRLTQPAWLNGPEKQEGRRSFFHHRARGGTVTARGHPRPLAFARGDNREQRTARFAACSHWFPAPAVAFDRESALFRATDFCGKWPPAQHAGDNREDVLLPLVAEVAQFPHKQRAMCIDLVEDLVSTAGTSCRGPVDRGHSHESRWSRRSQEPNPPPEGDRRWASSRTALAKEDGASRGRL